MDIIIVGCGRVGSTLTEQLAEEGHSITVVDTNATRVDDLSTTFDTMGIVGNGANYLVLQEAEIDKADLLIAVTDSDEVNMLCCLIAKKASGGNCPTIARVRNPIYNEEIDYIKEGLGLTMSINPEYEAAAEMSRILRRRSVIDINPFAKGRVELARFKIPEKSVLDGMPLFNIWSRLKADVLVAAIERLNQIIIPDGSYELHSGDTISFISTPLKAREFFKKIGMASDAVKSCMIVGGGNNGYYLAKQLLNYGIELKIIEKSKERCDELNHLLPQAIVINADGTDQNLLMESGLEYEDAFVSLTNMDEENVVLSLFAKQNTDAKVVTKLKRLNFSSVIEKLDLGSVIFPQNITTENILRYVRARNNSKDNSEVETLYKIIDNRAEALEFIIKNESSIVGVPLQDLKIKQNVLVGCITREGRSFIPRGKDSIQVGDSVIIITTRHGLSNIQDILMK